MMCELCNGYGKDVSLAGGIAVSLCNKHRREFDVFLVNSEDYNSWIYTAIAVKVAEKGDSTIALGEALIREYELQKKVRNIAHKWLNDKFDILSIEELAKEKEEKTMQLNVDTDECR